MVKDKDKDWDSIIPKIELASEIARIALDCEDCKDKVKKLIQNQNLKYRQEGGHSSLEEANEQVVTNGSTTITQQYK
jgi:hypothetical protein